jgi:tape measure domain-containing protein
MADPKIKYDIEADVKGDASIQQLEGSLRDLGQTLDGNLKTQAEAAAAALAALGAKQQAVDNFVTLRRETDALGSAMDTAAQKVDAIGAQLPQATAATAQFAEAEAKARAAVSGAKGDLDEQRQALTKLREEFTGAARKSDEFKEAEAQLRQTIKDLKINLAEKKQELSTAATATKQAERNEKELNTEYKNSINSAKQISTALGAKNRALDSSRSAMDAVGISTRNLAETERSLDAAVAAVKQEVLGLAPAYRAAQEASNASTQKQVQNQKTLRDGMQSISAQLHQIQQIATIALGGSYVGGLLKDVATTADEFKNLQARIKLATGEGANFQSSFAGVTDIALRTNSALESTGTLFARVTKAGQEAGLAAQAAQQQALGITETINQSVQLSGSSAEASNAAITQLIQGLQSGVLRGEEFNSVMEQAPRLAQALANGLGVSTGELRKMAEQGQLTSTTVIRALQSQSATVAAEFDKLPATVGRALQNLSTRWTLYVGEADKGAVSTANVAKIIEALSRNIDTLVSVLYAAGKAWAAIKIAGLAADMALWTTNTLRATAAVQASTAAVTANTAAHRANAAAIAGSGTAAASAVGKMGLLGRSISGLAGLVGGPLGLVAVFASLWPEIKSGGVALGEQAAKWLGFGKSIGEADKFLASFDATAKENAASLARQAQAAEDARNRQFGLSKAAAGLTAQFDEMRKKGDSASEAIGKIGKDFDLSNVPGIKDAVSVLDKLLADGKLTATEFQAAWSTALQGKDLAVFQVNAQAAFDQVAADALKLRDQVREAIAKGVEGKELADLQAKADAAFAASTRSAERLGQVLDASVREAVKRTGLDFEQLQGKIGAASRSANNDVEQIVQSMDKLKAAGVDVGRVLVASLTKAIDTADGQKSIEALQSRIQSLRSTLGDKITDGLLDQAKQKANELKDAVDKVTPGINSIREAYAQLGVQAPEDLQRIARANKSAWETIRSDGRASADTLQRAFETYANSAIAATGNVGTTSRAVTEALLRTEGAIKGLDVTFDQHGKLVVRTQADAASAINGTTTAIDNQVSATERLIEAEEKRLALIDRADALERKRIGVDKDGFSTGKDGNRFTAGSDISSLTGIAAFLKNAGVDDDKAARDIAREFADSRGNVQYADNPGQRKYGGDTLSMALLKAAEQYTFGTDGGTPQQPSTIPKPAVTVNLNLNGTTTAVNVASQDDADALVGLLQNLQTAGKRAI